MSITSIDLLRFILELLGDPSKADAFESDPTNALQVAGLGDVSCADVDAITPIIANAVPGAVAVASVGGSAVQPGEMIHHIIKNVAVSNYANNGLMQSIWADGDVQQAFASDGGLALGGDLLANDPIVLGDGNTVASDEAHAAGRDIIQNQGDGNLALGGDQTIAQDDGMIAGGDNIAEGDKVGGNNNQAPNTGNDNSVSVGGNQNNAENTGNDNSVSVGGNQNNAENTGNQTVHDESFTMGDVAVDLSDHSDNSVSVGGNQNNAENTGNQTVHDQSTSVGGNQNNAENTGNDNSVGGDYWENGSNVGGIGNTDNRNSGNTSDSGNTVAITQSDDHSLNVGTIAVDNSDNSDHSYTTGDTTYAEDHSTNVGDITVIDDHSYSEGDTVNVDDNSTNVGDVTWDQSQTTGDSTWVDDNSSTVGDVTWDQSQTTGDSTWVDDNSATQYSYEETSYDYSNSYGDYNEQGGGNTTVDVDVTQHNNGGLNNDYDYSYDG